jgi:hypothetical protein
MLDALDYLTPHEHAVACLRYAAKRRVRWQEPPPKPRAKREKPPQAEKPPKRGHFLAPRGAITAGIMGYLASNDPATGRQIAEALGLDVRSTRYRCKQLYAQGRLTHVGERAHMSDPAVYGLPPGRNETHQEA